MEMLAGLKAMQFIWSHQMLGVAPDMLDAVLAGAVRCRRILGVTENK